MTSVQDLLRSEDCTFPGCPAEADRDGLCRQHLGAVPVVAPDVRQQWTPEAIIGAIQRWASEHDGRPPTQAQWMKRGEWWPTFSTAARAFDGWGAAIEAAGLEKPIRGRKASAKTSSTPAVGDLAVTGAASNDLLGEGARSTPSAPAPLPVQPVVLENIPQAQLVARLRWAAGGEWSVLVSPSEAALLLEALA